MTKYRVHQNSIQCVECSEFHRQHSVRCSALRPFPILHGGSIPWWLAEIAFEYYDNSSERRTTLPSGWPGKSLERLAERGGFGVAELVNFIRWSEDYGWVNPTKEELMGRVL